MLESGLPCPLATGAIPYVVWGPYVVSRPAGTPRPDGIRFDANDLAIPGGEVMLLLLFGTTEATTIGVLAAGLLVLLGAGGDNLLEVAEGVVETGAMGAAGVSASGVDPNGREMAAGVGWLCWVEVGWYSVQAILSSLPQNWRCQVWQSLVTWILTQARCSGPVGGRRAPVFLAIQTFVRHLASCLSAITESSVCEIAKK